MPSSSLGQSKIKFKEKKGLHVIKENNITDLHTSSVHGIFFVVFEFTGFARIATT